MPAPTVTVVSPKSGPASGGTSIVLTGTGFTPTSVVSVGGTAATRVTVLTATFIIATVAPKSAGTYHVVVTTVGGPSASSSSDLFTYTVAASARVPTAGARVTSSSATGYWLVASHGGLFGFDDVAVDDPAKGISLREPIVRKVVT